MQNIKISIFLTMIVVSVFDVAHCLPDEKRTGRIMLTNGADSKRLNPSEQLSNSTAETLSHAMGFSCVTHVDQKFDFTIDINQARYANIKECVNIRFIDDFDPKIYDLDPLITSENKEGEISKLRLQHRDIKRHELENMLRNAPSGVLYLWIVDGKDLCIGINGDTYRFKDVSSRAGLRVDERYVNDTLSGLGLRDFNVIDFKAKTQLALDEQEYIRTALKLEKIKAADALGRCLASNINNPNLGSSGIPKACEESERLFRLFGHSSHVEDLIENFKK